jgi:hypothetical protein
MAIAYSSFGSIVGFPSMLDALQVIRPETLVRGTVTVFDVTAMEVAIGRWSPANRCGSARVDSPVLQDAKVLLDQLV